MIILTAHARYIVPWVSLASPPTRGATGHREMTEQKIFLIFKMLGNSIPKKTVSNVQFWIGTIQWITYVAVFLIISHTVLHGIEIFLLADVTLRIRLDLNWKPLISTEKNHAVRNLSENTVPKRKWRNRQIYRQGHTHPSPYLWGNTRNRCCVE